MAGDSILNTSTLFLFGKELDDLQIKTPSETGRVPRKGDNKFLQAQLAAKQDPRLARIYGYSYEGGFFEFARPAIFLVHGPGEAVDEIKAPPGQPPLSRAPGDPDHTGLGSQMGQFALNLMVWAYDKGDFSLRLSIATGTLDEILLMAELDMGDPRGQSSGLMARNSGLMARSSGLMARSSGLMARSSGLMARRGGSDLD